MKIIKRNGQEVDFDPAKISIAVSKANEEAPNADERLTKLQIGVVTEAVTNKLKALKHTANIEEIQDLVIHAIMQQQAYVVAQLYTEYRYKKALIRKANTTDDSILSLVNYENEEIKQENSNKNPMIASTQRDYIAGEVSKDLTMRVLLDDDIVDAHKKGILHFHDTDYFLQKIFNCDLINLEDMLQNGTVISGVKIDKPNSLATACNIATQIVAQVASNQYGSRMYA
jgi:ribonucleoside-triphosphate reductase